MSGFSIHCVYHKKDLIMKAIWNGKVIAESNNTINIKGNQYFPIDSVSKMFLGKSDTNTICAGKKQPHIIILRLMVRQIKMQFGTTQFHRTLLKE